MSTGYNWEGIMQVRATLLGARHVPERLCGGYVYLGRYIKCSTFTFTFTFRAKVTVDNVVYEESIDTKMNDLYLCLEVV